MWRAALLLMLAIISITSTVGPIEARLAARLGRALEARISRPMLAADWRVDGIIVLGGSTTRVAAALDLARALPEAAVVLSGPGPSEIDLARTTIAGSRLLVDRRAQNTFENALMSKQLVRPRPGACWLVVTSAVHMPRAVASFKAVGFPVVPWPVEDTPRQQSAASGWIWHEVFGLLGYRAAGRTQDVLPRCPDGFCTAGASRPVCGS
ncbi:MAG: YdcF family protein [Hyphomicrobiaceae bacterium]|nr:YdcF family protein [Hyphomicrobiaceae bacterium]